MRRMVRRGLAVALLLAAAVTPPLGALLPVAGVPAYGTIGPVSWYWTADYHAVWIGG